MTEALRNDQERGSGRRGGGEGSWREVKRRGGGEGS